MLDLPHDVARVYLPPDANCTLSTVHHCLRGRHHVNLVVASKEATALSWLTPEEADQHCVAGGGVWPQYSSFGGEAPDVVLTGVGVQTTAEVVAACRILQRDISGLRIRVVNITDLLILSSPNDPNPHPHALKQETFDALFPEEVPIIFNTHGYISQVKGLVSTRLGYDGNDHVRFLGYHEEGTTTTPWSMLRCNGVDRFSVAQHALELLPAHPLVSPKATSLHAQYEHAKRYQEKFAEEHGEDPEEYSSLPPPVEPKLN
jgi:xylulose-5-phosphate/fructose-6-phosphate phosphoketolase